MKISQERRNFQIDIRKKKSINFYNQSRKRRMEQINNTKINKKYLANLQILLSKPIILNRKNSHRATSTISLYV
jgi:hypothetical protein